MVVPGGTYPVRMRQSPTAAGSPAATGPLAESAGTVERVIIVGV